MNVTKHPPSAELQRAATVLVEQLRMVTYPERGWVSRHNDDPPGRLDTRQLIQRRAQVAKGGQPTAKPFVHRKREKIKQTKITAGFMFDGSGSQGGVQETVGDCRWLTTEALDRVGGEVAAVRFGAVGTPVQAPGEKLLDVEVYEAYDGWENFIEGFSLIDAALDIIDGDGARILFIFTDGYFNEDRAVEYAEVVMDMCRQSGVAVLWLDAGNGFSRPDAYGHGEIVSIGDVAPVEVAKMLGEAIIAEFRRVAPQHA